MKKILFIFYLHIIVHSLFGQSILSSDAYRFIENEKSYTKLASSHVIDILRKNDKVLGVANCDFKIIPTFKAIENYLKCNVDSFLLSLEIDNKLLMNQILLFDSKIYLAGYTFCKLSNCDIYLYDDNPSRFIKVKKAVNDLIINEKYDLIFQIENQHDYWFLWKNNKLNCYSFRIDAIVDISNFVLKDNNL